MCRDRATRARSLSLAVVAPGISIAASHSTSAIGKRAESVCICAIGSLGRPSYTNACVCKQCLGQEGMSLRQFAGMPGGEPMPDCLLAHLVLGHGRNDL